MAKRLSAVGVGQVQLYFGDFAGGKGIMEGDRGVGIGAGIDNQCAGVLGGVLYIIDQRAF